MRRRAVLICACEVSTQPRSSRRHDGARYLRMHARCLCSHGVMMHTRAAAIRAVRYITIMFRHVELMHDMLLYHLLSLTPLCRVYIAYGEPRTPAPASAAMIYRAMLPCSDLPYRALYYCRALICHGAIAMPLFDACTIITSTPERIVLIPCRLLRARRHATITRFTSLTCRHGFPPPRASAPPAHNARDTHDVACFTSTTDARHAS